MNLSQGFENEQGCYDIAVIGQSNDLDSSGTCEDVGKAEWEFGACNPRVCDTGDKHVLAGTGHTQRGNAADRRSEKSSPRGAARRRRLCGVGGSRRGVRPTDTM